MTIKNVCLLGADGTLGPSILQALVKNNFNVTVLKRQSSKSPSNYPQGVNVARFDENIVVEDLVPILRDQHALVVTIKGTQVDIQKRLADACVKAGVSRLIPATLPPSMLKNVSHSSATRPSYDPTSPISRRRTRTSAGQPSFVVTSSTGIQHSCTFGQKPGAQRCSTVAMLKPRTAR